MSGSYGRHTIGEIVSNKRLLSYCGLNNHDHHIWQWECVSCLSKGGPSTISHISRSSSCKRCRGQNSATWKGYRDISGTFLGQYRWDAKRKGRSFTVTAEDLWKIWEDQGGLCAYSGLPLVHGETASIDRIDSSIGYTKGNVQWVHRDINRMKTDFNEDYFISLCQSVATYKENNGRAKR